MKTIRGKLPSREKREYFLWSLPPFDLEKRISKTAARWTSSNVLPYKNSGLVYSRNIFSNKAREPATRIEEFLRAIDYSMIDSITSPDNDQEILSGKWLIYTGRKAADIVWQTLAEDIENGRIPCPAKISTMRKNMYLKYRFPLAHVICVYTPNFLWRDNVREVRLLLRKSGFVKKLFYRPDVFTVLETGQTSGTFFPRNIFKLLRKYGISTLHVKHRYYG